jgi:hypothetical protein
VTEAQVSAWYLRDSIALSDGEVIDAVAAILQRPSDLRATEELARTRERILLCIAESRRLTVPEAELIHPDLRRA